ncbi:PRP38 family [Babesia microti strain RI]|uniref:Pre-mRNA-splicing factor 38 n=1 Tax=Babesia microti (strain RI) TaxID=1133968 RepID=A0A1N6LXV5_BABMR|nr:PRP38 family [Babesia microti strain RI]SIO73693.1 PRP38 family [Babesia microti strain RI]|eukprot:XP_021337761.1 PRP38 family [Babesia microti strain RI]
MDIHQYNNISQESTQFGFFDTDSTQDIVPKCHMHNKHQNGCRFCVKYKESLNNSKKSDNYNYYNSNLSESSHENNTVISNLNPILRNNILSSEYYKSIAGFDTFEEILQEIHQHADHAEPFCSANRLKPSTLFCCLYKLFTMNLEDDNLNLLLEDTTSVYARCCGFLYIRYSFHYEKLYKWFKPYLLDIQEFTIDLAKSKTVTLGGYLHSLLIDEKYFTIVLPRLPIKFKNNCVPEILEFEEFRRRKITNLRNIEQFTSNVQIEFFDGQRWKRGQVIEVHPKGGLTTITVSKSDGMSEIVDLSAIKLPSECKDDDKRSGRYDGSRSRDRDYRGSRDRRRSRSRDRDRNRYRNMDRDMRRDKGRRSKSVDRTYGNHRNNKNSNYDDRYEEYKRIEREKALASGKDYSRRPSSFKSSLSCRANIYH